MSITREEDKDKEVLKLGMVKAVGVKTIEVKAKSSMSVRGQVIAEMKEGRDIYFPDRYFCDKFHVSNQQINQLMRQLENQKSITRNKPQVADPYGQLPNGQRIMNRWKE